MLGTFCRGWRSPSMGNSSPVSGFLLSPAHKAAIFCGHCRDGLALHSFVKPRTRERVCAYECGHYSPNGTLSPGIVVCVAGKPILLFCSPSFKFFFFFFNFTLLCF
ncbi:unnamed protein product [Ixodes pacificus]